MRNVFNLGIGLLVVVERGAADRAIAALGGAGERAWAVGEVVAVPAGTPFEERVKF
jgi:phosphoribosylformylglycinamidine cyclo-ligase